jgi:hypothetical protein
VAQDVCLLLRLHPLSYLTVTDSSFILQRVKREEREPDRTPPCGDPETDFVDPMLLYVTFSSLPLPCPLKEFYFFASY